MTFSVPYNSTAFPSSRRSKSAFLNAIFASNFTGKELDEETGYGYFGARYYDATLLTGWTAVDPMSDKYPNISPYAYCNWNSVKLVDPDGRDWYQNELTGAIYYNNRVNGAAAAGTGAMEGEGWKYLGKNGMFAIDRYHNTDFNIVATNGGSVNYNKYTGCIDMELSLDGGKAKTVMESVGYKQVSTQVITYNKTYIQESFGSGSGSTIHCTYGIEYEYTEKTAYVPNSFRESSRTIVGRTVYGEYDPMLNSWPYANRQTISYTEPSAFEKVLGVIFSGLNTVHGGYHDYVDRYNCGNISNYHGGNILINKILNR